MSKHIFAADTSTTTPVPSKAWRRATAFDAGFAEGWLQNAIVATPLLVMAPYLEAEESEEEWFYWAKEHRTAAGNIDILLVSNDGRVALVETKLSTNPGNRREVVAQVIDYAAHLQDRAYTNLPKLPVDKEGQPVVAIELVQQCIAEGNLLLVIASDEMDARAVRLASALQGDHITRGWELVMVDVGVYEPASKGSDKNLLLVPHLRGIIKPVERQVVRISVADGSARARVEHVRPNPDGSDPELLAVVDTFNATAPKSPAIVSGKRYSQILIPRWPSSIHYEFLLHTKYGNSVDLHFEAKRLNSVAEALRTQLPLIRHSVPNAEWDQNWSSAGRIRIPIQAGSVPTLWANTMQDLIGATRSTVEEALTQGGLMQPASP